MKSFTKTGRVARARIVNDESLSRRDKALKTPGSSSIKRGALEFDRIGEIAKIHALRRIGQRGERLADQLAKDRQHHEGDTERLAGLSREGGHRFVMQAGIDAVQRCGHCQATELELMRLRPVEQYWKAAHQVVGRPGSDDRLNMSLRVDQLGISAAIDSFGMAPRFVPARVDRLEMPIAGTRSSFRRSPCKPEVARLDSTRS